MGRARIGTETTELLERLSLLGADEQGGVTRLLYDRAWQEGQRFVAEAMAEAGLDVRLDSVGNVYGRLAGTGDSSKCVLTGSHIDTVRNGGKYDGALGVAAGIVALSRLAERYGRPRRTLEVVSFCEEEGSRFPLAYWGSGNVTAGRRFDGALAAADPDGITLASAMAAAGFDPGAVRESARDDIEAFVELHIEQGEVLERAGRAIGIVDAIFGQRRYTVEVEGRSGHAGTTPMAMRSDALASAAEMIAWLRRAASAVGGGGLVATVGRLEVSPNVPNVIPGKARFTLDIRHRDEGALSVFCESIESRFREIAGETGTGISFECWLAEPPVRMDDGLGKQIAAVCDRSGWSWTTVGSGAGHDAGLFAATCRTAMIFVPSREGVSHSPEEYTSPEELERGVDVLTELLYQLAYGEGAS